MYIAHTVPVRGTRGGAARSSKMAQKAKLKRFELRTKQQGGICDTIQ